MKNADLSQEGAVSLSFVVSLNVVNYGIKATLNK